MKAARSVGKTVNAHILIMNYLFIGSVKFADHVIKNIMILKVSEKMTEEKKCEANITENCIFVKYQFNDLEFIRMCDECGKYKEDCS